MHLAGGGGGGARGRGLPAGSGGGGALGRVGKWAVGSHQARRAAWVVAAAVRTRGGPTGVAHEPVMKPSAWAPFVPGKPLKAPFSAPVRGGQGQWPAAQWAGRNTPFREAFPAAGPRVEHRGEGGGAARGARPALRGQEANIKTKI